MDIEKVRKILSEADVVGQCYAAGLITVEEKESLMQGLKEHLKEYVVVKDVGQSKT